jgi:hypothetical protein
MLVRYVVVIVKENLKCSGGKPAPTVILQTHIANELPQNRTLVSPMRCLP